MFVITQGAAIDRFLDPHTKEPIAAIGWIEWRGKNAREYWVSLPEGPIEFFRTKETAQGFFNRSTRELKRQQRTETAKRRNSAYA